MCSANVPEGPGAASAGVAKGRSQSASGGAGGGLARPEKRWEGPPWPTTDARSPGGEHGCDKSGGGLAIGANCGRPTSAVGLSGGVAQAAALRFLAWPAVELEVFLGPPQQVLEAAFRHLSRCSQARRYRRQ